MFTVCWRGRAGEASDGILRGGGGGQRGELGGSERQG